MKPEAFTELVTRLRADNARMGRNNSAAAVSRQVDAVLTAAKRGSQAPSPSRPKPRPGPTPKPSTTKPTPTTKPNEGETTMLRKKSAPKTKIAPKPPKPTRRSRVRIEVPAELLNRPERLAPIQQTRILQSAHDESEVSPCDVCGGEADPTDDRFGPWRRHGECANLNSQPWMRLRAAARALLGIELPDAVFIAAHLDVPRYSDIHGGTTYATGDARTAWAHVDRKAITTALMTARKLLAEAARPAACELGPCAICGAVLAVRWFDSDHVRPDESAAPLCDGCFPIFDRTPGSARFYDDQRGVISEAMTGVPPNMGDEFPAGLRAHAETGGGDGSPWSHLPTEAVEAYRWSMWARSGGRYAPDEHRAEAMARLATRAAGRSTSTDGDPFGFNIKGEKVDDD